MTAAEQSEAQALGALIADKEKREAEQATATKEKAAPLTEAERSEAQALGPYVSDQLHVAAEQQIQYNKEKEAQSAAVRLQALKDGVLKLKAEAEAVPLTKCHRKSLTSFQGRGSRGRRRRRKSKRMSK